MDMGSKMKSPSAQTETPIESLPYEAALEQLEEIINTLELGEQTLEQSLAYYERGQALARRCSYLLDQAELKVKMLSGDDLIDFEPES
jgi:exodeoxyribonuclease VII small subunit